MKKKPEIYEFDPQIYPVKLWVTITNDVSIIEERFDKYPSLKPYKVSRDIKETADAFVDTVAMKSNGEIGELVVFKSLKCCTPGVMAHEASHISDRIWKRIGENKKGKEANAYLVEWIVNCIDKVRRGIV